MIVTCPSCDAQYLLPDDAIGAKGRKVKCTTCSYVWTQAPQEDPNDFQITFEDAPDLPDTGPRHTMTPVARESGMGRILGFGALFGVLLLVMTMGYAIVIRHSIVSSWAPSALFFEAIGMPVPAAGSAIQINSVQTSLVNTEEGGKALKIRGIMKNTATSDQHLSVMKISMNGKDPSISKDWTIELYGKTLPAEQEARFEYSLADAPEDGQSVSIRFLD